MIHASGDFDFASSIRYSLDFASAIQAAFHARAPIVTDTEMVLLGIRSALADRPHLTILIIGNAPTALEEALRLIKKGWRPSAIIGMPVGFVGVEEAKQHLLEQSAVPYLTCLGRKGGSAVTAAAMNALVEWHQPHLV
jgi:precorrin isomerase